MVEQLVISDDYYIPDANRLVTEDDTPVDNFASAKQQRLLVSCLYSALQKQTFLAEANVGIYHTDGQPAIVPDVFLSLDVQVPDNWWEKQNRCYLVWKFGKPPEVVMEILSNQVGDELGKNYASMNTCGSATTLFMTPLNGWEKTSSAFTNYEDAAMLKRRKPG